MTEQLLVGFSNWTSLRELSIGVVPEYGDLSCVYCIRSAQTGEVLYIGSTGCLRRRIFGNYIGGVGGRTTRRLHGILFTDEEVTNVELAYAETNEYRTREKQLLRAFRLEHGRLPRWNRQAPTEGGAGDVCDP